MDTVTPGIAAAGSGPRALVIACGAIAHELVATLERAGLGNGAGGGPVRVECLPADFHDTPEKIVPAVRAKLDAARESGLEPFVAYGDCGTGGRLDALLRERGVERLPGAHCYAFFAGTERFDALAAEEPGTFWLTDWLARNFERLVVRGLGIDRHPELASVYFGNYARVVHLAQSPDEGGETARDAEAAARTLGLPLERVATGLEPFAASLLPALGARAIRVHAAPSHRPA